MSEGTGQHPGTEPGVEHERPEGGREEVFAREPSIVREPAPGGHKWRMRLGPVRLAIIAAVLIPAAFLVFNLVDPDYDYIVYAVIVITTFGIALAVDPDREW